MNGDDTLILLTFFFLLYGCAILWMCNTKSMDCRFSQILNPQIQNAAIYWYATLLIFFYHISQRKQKHNLSPISRTKKIKLECEALMPGCVSVFVPSVDVGQSFSHIKETCSECKMSQMCFEMFTKGFYCTFCLLEVLLLLIHCCQSIIVAVENRRAPILSIFTLKPQLRDHRVSYESENCTTSSPFQKQLNALRMPRGSH